MKMARSSRRLFLAGLSTFIARPARSASKPIVFAAASLKSALDELFREDDVSISYGGSGTLARQISQGAPADLFISANPEWMDVVEPKLVPGTRVDLLSNRIVLIGAEETTLADLPDGTRVATGMTNAVPLGQYVKHALMSLGLWERLRPQLIEVENAQLAVTLVTRGEVPFGLVYASDLGNSAELKLLETLPEDSHPAIRYPVGLLRETARPLYDRLFTPEARGIFTQHGFEVL